MRNDPFEVCQVSAIAPMRGGRNIKATGQVAATKQWSAQMIDELLALPCSESVRFQVGPTDRDGAFPLPLGGRGAKIDSLLLSARGGTAAVDCLG